MRAGPKPGPKPKISRADIAEAVIHLGFQDVSLTRVADHLGVSHSALYKHVDDRGDAIIAAADLLTERVSWPAMDDDWRAFLRAGAIVVWRTFCRHPGLYQAVDESNRVPTAFQAHLGDAHAHLVSLGFTVDTALLAIDTTYDLAADAANRANQLRARETEELEDLSNQWSEPLDGPLAEAMAAAISGDPEPWFLAKLDLVLTGIAHAIAPPPMGGADR